MLQLYTCVANQYDLRLVAAAAVMCALGSYTTFALREDQVLEAASAQTTIHLMRALLIRGQEQSPSAESLIQSA